MAAAIADPPRLAADLKALRLSTVAAQWQPLAEQADRQRQTPADYLAQLVHLEVTARRERRIHDARFPMLKTLDAFSFEAQSDLERAAVLQVFDCRFVADAANVVFVGGVGTGKTHLSIALGMACCHHDYRVRFVTAAELVTMLVEAQQQGRLARKLARLDVVHVDDLGYAARQDRRRPAVRVHQPALRTPQWPSSSSLPGGPVRTPTPRRAETPTVISLGDRRSPAQVLRGLTLRPTRDYSAPAVTPNVRTSRIHAQTPNLHYSRRSRFDRQRA